MTLDRLRKAGGGFFTAKPLKATAALPVVLVTEMSVMRPSRRPTLLSGGMAAYHRPDTASTLANSLNGLGVIANPARYPDDIGQ